MTEPEISGRPGVSKGDGSLRICIVSDVFPPRYGGPGVQSFELAKRFKSSGADVFVITSGAQEKYVIDGLEVFAVGAFEMGHLKLFRYSMQVARALFRHRKRFDIVQFFSVGRSVYLPLIIAKMCGKKAALTSSMLGDDDLATIGRGKLGRLYLWIVSRADAYLANSHRIAEVSEAAAGDRVKVVDMQMGVDTDKFRPISLEERAQIRKSLAISEHAHVCLFMGAISRRKGVDLLIEAWPLVKAQMDGAVLILLGPLSWLASTGDHAAFGREVKRVADDSSLGIRMTETRDVAQYLQASDLFTLPSRQEGLPNAVLEALATGLPLVFTRSEWITSDFIEHGVNGLLVEEENPSALSEAILGIFRDSNSLESMGRASREIALTRYSMDLKVGHYLELYRSFV